MLQELSLTQLANVMTAISPQVGIRFFDFIENIEEIDDMANFSVEDFNKEFETWIEIKDVSWTYFFKRLFRWNCKIYSGGEIRCLI